MVDYWKFTTIDSKVFAYFNAVSSVGLDQDNLKASLDALSLSEAFDIIYYWRDHIRKINNRRYSLLDYSMICELTRKLKRLTLIITSKSDDQPKKWNCCNESIRPSDLLEHVKNKHWKESK